MTIRVATVAGDLDREAILAEALSFRDEVSLVLRCVDRVELLAAIRGGDLHALVFVGSPPWLDRQCLVEAASRGIGAIAVADDDPNVHPSGIVGREADIGTIVRACSSAPPLALPAASPAGSDRGRLTGVWGPKGAPGRTRVAIELAFALTDTGIGTLLVDADPYGGDILQALGIIEELPTVVWASRMAAKEELDQDQIRTNLRSVERGPTVLPGLPRAELWADVSRFAFDELLRVSRGCFDHTVVDVGFCLEPGHDPYGGDDDGRNRMARAALAEADNVVCVCSGDPVGIKNFLWAFETVTAIADLDRITIVVNRARGGSEREISHLLAKHAGKKPTAFLPDESKVVDAALEECSSVRMVKGSSQMVAGIEALAVSVGARPKPRGLLLSLGGRK